MAPSHPLPARIPAQRVLTMLVATCLTLLALSAGAAAGTSQPTATVSSVVLHRALVTRAADQRQLAHNSSKLTICVNIHSSNCTSQRRAVAQSRTKLASAERQVRSLSGRIARRQHTPKGTHTPPTTDGSTGAGSNGTGSAGTGSSSTSSNGAGSAADSGSSGSSATGTGSTGSGSVPPGSTETVPPASTETSSTGSGSSNFGQPFVKGVNTNLQGWGPAAEPQITHEIAAVGAHWAREDLNWSKIEPQRGVYDWSSFDQMVAIAQANGVTILPVAGYAPSWTTPESSADYAAFIAAAVARYGPGTAANLQTWELWNEPYYSYAWSGKPGDPAAYARDVLAASQAAKKIASTVKILMAAEDGDAAAAGGGWWTTSVQAYFAAVPDLGKWIDGVAVHPYGDDPSVPVKETEGFRGTTGGWSFQRIDSIRAAFLAHGVNVPFWITEIGWTTSEMSEAEQAHNYEDLTTQVAARPWVRGMFSYCLREFNNNPGDSEAQFGLEKYGTWQPKQAFFALQKAFSTLS